jgi:hypothetical protein
LRDDEAAAIAGFEFYEDIEGRSQTRKAVGYTKKVKLTDKISALTLLGKIRNFFKVPPESPRASRQGIDVNVNTTRTPDEAYLKMARGK